MKLLPFNDFFVQTLVFIVIFFLYLLMDKVPAGFGNMPEYECSAYLFCVNSLYRNQHPSTIALVYYHGYYRGVVLKFKLYL